MPHLLADWTDHANAACFGGYLHVEAGPKEWRAAPLAPVLGARGHLCPTNRNRFYGSGDGIATYRIIHFTCPVYVSILGKNSVNIYLNFISVIYLGILILL